jgi:hypothetical protein
MKLGICLLDMCNDILLVFLDSYPGSEDGLTYDRWQDLEDCLSYGVNSYFDGESKWR